MRLSLIVAMSENRVIGRNNDLPWHISADLKRFRRITTGHPIIMGRKNHESIGRVLPERKNIILTRQRDYVVPGATVCHSLDEALRACEGAEEAFIIGGAEVYREALPQVDRIYLTRVHAQVEGDVYFPPHDDELFEEVERFPGVGEPQHTFLVLDRKSTRAGH